MPTQPRTSASLSAFSFGTILTSAATLLALVAAVACQSRGPGLFSPTTSNDLAGDYQVTYSLSTDACQLGFGPGVGPPTPVPPNYSIHVTGASVSVSSPCIDSSWPATWDGTVITMQFNRTQVSSSTCSWQINEMDTGTLDSVGLSGDAIMTVSAIGNCGSGFPCQVQSTFTAVNCAKGPCKVLNCG